MTDKIPDEPVAPERSTAPGWFLLTVPALLVWGWTLWAAPEELLVPVLSAGGLTLVLLAVCAMLLARRDRKVRELRARVEQARAEAEAASARTAALAEEDLPHVIERLRQGESTGRVLHSLPRPQDPAGQALLDLVVGEISKAEQRRAATVAACATAAGRIQAMSTTMLADLRQMQDRYGDGTGGGDGGDVLGDLMHLDHTVAQTGRIADSIAVLTGARSGRRWARSIPLESIVRGAMSRIGGYQRVRLHHVPAQAIAGFAAEGIIHALAEILDNAAKFSPPTAEVHVHVEEVQAGVAIMVEDGGLIMGEEALDRARESVGRSTDIGAISGTRLGLSVVGLIAQRYDLSISFRASARGGTAVVLLLPRTLVKPLSSAGISESTRLNASASLPAPPAQAADPARNAPANPQTPPAPAPRAEAARTEAQAASRAETGAPTAHPEQPSAAPRAETGTPAVPSAGAVPVEQAGAPRAPRAETDAPQAPRTEATAPTTPAAAPSAAVEASAMVTPGENAQAPATANPSTEDETRTTTGPHTAPTRTEAEAGPAAEGTDTPRRHASGLPMRRRGQTLTAKQRPGPESTAPKPATPPRGFEAFRSAVRGQDQTGTQKDG